MYAPHTRFLAAQSLPLLLLLACGSFGLLAACSESDVGVAPPTFIPDADTGTDDTDTTPPPPSCDIPSGGECDGATLRYCENKEVHTLECDQLFDRGYCRRAGLQAQCHVPTGDVCAVKDGSATRYARCQGSSSACVTDAFEGTYTCREDVGSCKNNEVGSCVENKNQYYLQGCINGQPRAYDCVAMGGRCAGTGCQDLPLGAICETNVSTALHHLICDKSLKCEGATVTDLYGVCVPK